MVATLEDELTEIDNDVKWLHGNYNELINQYNEDYIAIKNQNVIDHNDQLDKLKEMLEKKELSLQKY